VLLLKHGLIVRSQLFKVHQVIGNPMSTVERLSDWNVDELVLLDISADDYHDLRRDDIQQRYQGTSAVDVLREVAKVCFMPLTFGGRIRTLDDIAERISAGADKVRPLMALPIDKLLRAYILCQIDRGALSADELLARAEKL
jgi:imidazole glycerol phosphate synthase subunit HisF